MPAQAADAERRYDVRTFERLESCGDLNRAVAMAKREDDWGALYGFSLYTMGYLTAINRLAYNTYDIGGKKNSKTLMLWLQQYCAEHPQSSFSDALYQMTLAQFPDRSTTKPVRAAD